MQASSATSSRDDSSTDPAISLENLSTQFSHASIAQSPTAQTVVPGTPDLASSPLPTQELVLRELGAYLRSLLEGKAFKDPICNDKPGLYRCRLEGLIFLGEGHNLKYSDGLAADPQELKAWNERWPRTLDQADSSQHPYTAMEMTQLKWNETSQEIENVTTEHRLQRPSSGVLRISTRAYDVPPGQTCFIQLDTRSRCLSHRAIAHIATQLLTGLVVSQDYHQDAPGRYLNEAITQFLLSFSRGVHTQFDSQFDNTSWGPWSETTSPFSAIFHHLRFLSSAPDHNDHAWGRGTGLYLQRQGGRMNGPYFPCVAEGRISIGVMSRKTADDNTTKYNGVCVAQTFGGNNHFREAMRLHQGDEVKDELGPVACFLRIYFSVIPAWYNCWSSFLDDVDEVFSIQPRDVLTVARKDFPLYCDALNDSDKQFQVLQLLRISTVWIQSTVRALQRTKAEIMTSEMKKAAASNSLFAVGWTENLWDAVEEALDQSSKELIERIDRKTEEIKSLRDGLFHTVSMGEAKRGTRINEYMFIFTVMTIMYLPLNLIASLYGNSIDFFHFTDAAQRIELGTVIVSVSVFTYLAALLMVWLVRRRVRVKDVSRLFRAAYSKTKTSLCTLIPGCRSRVQGWWRKKSPDSPEDSLC